MYWKTHTLTLVFPLPSLQKMQTLQTLHSLPPVSFFLTLSPRLAFPAAAADAAWQPLGNSRSKSNSKGKGRARRGEARRVEASQETDGWRSIDAIKIKTKPQTKTKLNGRD